MSKNLTRKGLALGAIVALASTVIAGSPAFAAQTITTAPALGTSLNTTLATPFVVAANVSGATTDTAAATLKFSVSNAGKNLLTFAAVGASASAANTAALAGTRVADTTNTTVVSAASTGLTSAKTAAIAISVANTVTVSTTADVTAWLDLDGDNVIDANEDTANTVSVKFLANADLAAATTITAPLIGAVALTGKSVITPALNSNYATNVTIDYTAATSVTSTGATTLGTDGAWTSTAVIAAATAGAYTAQAKVATVALGTAASTTVAAITTATATAALTAGNDATAAGVVREGAKAATAVLTLKKAVVAPATVGLPVAAGIPVVVTVKTKAVAAPATSLITVDGTAINATDEGTITLNKVTDANGLVSLAIASATGTVTDAIEITALAEGVSAAALNVVWTAVSYTAASTSAFASTERSIVEGGSTTLTYAVKDQFGVAIAVPSRLKFTVGYATVGPVAADAITYVALVAGSASITVTDTTANVDAAIAVAAALEVQDASTLNYAAPTSGAVTAAAHNVNVTATAAAFTTAPAATFAAAVDTAVSLGSPVINNAGGVVTIAGTGVTFTVNSIDYANTVTVITGAGGALPAVTAKSTTAGAKNITFTVGTNVNTSVLTVAVAVETSGTVLTLDAPATILPGRTLVVTGKLVDKFGNPVDITSAAATLAVVYTGPGLIVGALPTSTEVDGTFTFRVLLGANETGSAAVSASYDSNGATADVAGTTVAITVAKTVTIGAAAATNGAVIASKNGRVYVTVNSPAGFKSYVKVGFSVKPSFTTTGSKLVSYYVGAGKRVAVRVYVRGGLVASQAITIK
jgi:hypothetical protein